MTATTVVTQGPSPEEDFGLDAIVQHNAAQTTEDFPPYQDDAKGLGIYDVFQDEPSYTHNPPTPRSNTASEGIRTRSGRSTRGRTDSPFSTTKSRVSKSPAARSKKDKKSKVDRAKTPKLTAPLSVLTKDMSVPLKDMDAWVHRDASTRQKEVEKRNGYVTRPMNSFMLYRSAYAERTKQWCLQNNHQVVSSVSGESWPMEPDEVREQFNEWARLERENHAKAHPEYKFSPSKTNKRRKGDFSDDEDAASDTLDQDPDGEYRGPGRSVRQRRQQHDLAGEVAYVPSNVGFTSNPYYDQQQLAGYDQYGYVNAARPLPSNAGYDGSNIIWNPQTGTYVQTSMPQQQPQYQYAGSGGMRVPTPQSLNGNPSSSLGGYGLPGGQISTDDLFTSSRTNTPMQQQQQQYNQYGQPVYQQYAQQYPAYQQPQAQHMYEHAQYLQQASQPQAAIDPGLEAALAGQQHPGESHFEDALGELTNGDFVGGVADYGFEESGTSPSQTLAPAWPGEGLT